jgi:YidC/Oxa1 family membrane protein insertase
MQIMQPKSDDPAQQQSNAILKVLPIMIGWFSLNVPAALTIYWVTNNIITTVTSVIIRQSLKTEPVKVGGSTAAAEPPKTVFAPPREKPAGFAPSPVSPSEVKPLTAMDAEIVADDDDADDDDDTEEEDESEDSPPSGTGMDSSSSAPKKKRGGGKKRKRKKN